jgi:hypothetical protein
MRNTLNIEIGYGQRSFTDRTEQEINQLQNSNLGTVLERSTNLWADVLLKLHLTLFRRWARSRLEDLAEWDTQLSTLWKRLDEVRLELLALGLAWVLSEPQAMQKIMKGICKVFLGLHRLVSDADHVLRVAGYCSVSMANLKTVPSRHKVIARLITSAPGRFMLKEEVEATVDAMEEGTRHCCICLESWDNEGFRDSLSRLQRIIAPETLQTDSDEWLWGDATQSDRCSFTIRPGFECVPLKMGCGHVFCAGCIAKFLRQDEGYRCPFRDSGYGIERSWDMEKLVQRLGNRSSEHVFGR